MPHPCLQFGCHHIVIVLLSSFKLSRLGASHAASEDDDQHCVRSGSLLEKELTSLQRQHLTWVIAFA